MSLKPYHEYKDSGVDWVGSVPTHWPLSPIRSVVEERRIKNPDGNEAFYLSLVSGRGVMPYSQKGDIGNKMPEDLSRCKVVEEGDLVINSMNYGIGSYGVSSYQGVCSPVYIVLRPRPSVDVSFIKRIFEVSSFQKLAQSFGSGILEHRRAISWENLRTLRVPVPTLTEQRVIAEFLDRETAEIDAFIADQERLIELLEERRAATITHAVTKGLDPDRPIKDSGVESLGEVPADWDVVAVSRFVSFGNGSDYKHVEVVNGGYPVIGSGGEFRRASEYLFDGESVLFGRKGTVDKPLYVTGKFWTVDTMYYTNIDTRYLVPKFLYYWALRIPFDFYLTNTALPSMTQTDLGSAKIALPGRAEQDRIVQYIDREMSELDAAVSDAREAIVLSRERRAALISAAVTGQLDVSQHNQPVVEAREDEVRV